MQLSSNDDEGEAKVEEEEEEEEEMVAQEDFSEEVSNPGSMKHTRPIIIQYHRKIYSGSAYSYYS